jgi:hypothetical protein
MSYDFFEKNNRVHYRPTPSGRLECWRGSRQIDEVDTVSVALDVGTEPAVLLKVGQPGFVNGWVADVRSKMGKFASAVQVYTGPFDADQLNRLLTHSGYGRSFLEAHGITPPPVEDEDAYADS